VKATREIRLERLLNRLQRDVEQCPSSPDVRQRRRTVMRGIRIAIWALGSSPVLSYAAIEAEFRGELFQQSAEFRRVKEVESDDD
jgi:hypothetical protein